MRLSFKVIEISSLKEFGTTWRHRSRSIPHRWSTMTMRLSCAVTEIWGLKYFGARTLTFWGHVTSSVTWSLDSSCAVHY